MRFESKNVKAIKQAAAAKLGKALTAQQDVRGFVLNDSRDSLQRARDMSRKPVPAAGETWADRERAKLAKDKREAKLAKLSRNERLLAVMDEIAEREITEASEHPRLEAVLAIRDRIRFDPSREQAALDFANLVMDQHAAGMDANVAAEMFEQLVAQEELHINTLRSDKLGRQQALLAELAALDVESATLPSDSNRFRLLQAAAQRGLPMAEGDHDALAAADANPVLQSALVGKYAPQIDAYAAEVAA